MSTPRTAPPPYPEMVEFVLRWLDHGGGPAADISDQFAIPADEFFTTVLSHLDQDPPAPIHPAVLERVKSVARKRLWLLN